MAQHLFFTYFFNRTTGFNYYINTHAVVLGEPCTQRQRTLPPLILNVPFTLYRHKNKGHTVFITEKANW